MFQMVRVQMAFDRGDRFIHQPEQQIQRVDGLVDHQAAAFGRPAAPPGALQIILVIPPPGEKATGGKNRSKRLGCQKLAGLPGCKVIPVLQADTELPAGSTDSFGQNFQVSLLGGSRFFQQNVATSLQRLARQTHMGMVRGQDVDHIRMDCS